MSSVPVGLLKQRANDLPHTSLRGDQQAAQARQAEQVTESPALYPGAPAKRGEVRRAETEADGS